MQEALFIATLLGMVYHFFLGKAIFTGEKLEMLNFIGSIVALCFGAILCFALPLQFADTHAQVWPIMIWTVLCCVLSAVWYKRMRQRIIKAPVGECDDIDDPLGFYIAVEVAFTVLGKACLTSVVYLFVL